MESPEILSDIQKIHTVYSLSVFSGDLDVLFLGKLSLEKKKSSNQVDWEKPVGYYKTEVDPVIKL